MVSFRATNRFVQRIDVMAAHRGADRTELIIRIMDWAMAIKEDNCDHMEKVENICVECGKDYDPQYVEFTLRLPKEV